jgi:hypothetical protein
MKRRRLILAGVAAALLAALPVGWYFGSPWWTLWRMREAARAGDVRRLGSYFDFQAMLREGQKQSRATWRSLLAVAQPDSSGGRQLIEMATRSLGKPAAAVMIRPQDLRPWFANFDVRWGGLGSSSTGRFSPYIVHRGLNSFEVRERGASEKYGPLLTFRRHGLGWKLVAVRWGQQ